MTKKIFLQISLCIIMLFACICRKADEKTTRLSQWQNLSFLPGQIEITYPLSNTLFPPDIIAPKIVWEDKKHEVDEWLVVAHAGDKKDIASCITHVKAWQPDSSHWEDIKKSGLHQDIFITVLGYTQGQIVSGAETTIRTCGDSVAAPVFYRSVPLPFHFALQNLDSIRWHLGNISSSKPPPALMKNLPLCGNCHSFTRDGKILAMDVDYANDKGSYVISEIASETRLTAEKIITWESYRSEDGQKTFGLLSQISPDGRYAISTVKDRSIFVAKDDLAYSQLFFPIKGILVYYDRQQKTFHSLPGADDPAFVQSNPTWSPDGQVIYFARAPVYHSVEAEKSTDVVLPTSVAAEFIEGRRGFKYDICRIPFHDGRGGIAQPVPGASRNGMSNFFPRVSPNGKWLVFTRAKNFMLLQPDSKLYIVPAQGGTPREMNCNLPSMNSWHSWSPNSAWLVFSSKGHGPFTNFYLTHIDENGNDSPPVLLANLSFKNRAGNIPEFINTQPSRWTKVVDDFSDQPHYYFTLGKNKIGEKKYSEALAAFNKGLLAAPNNVELLMFKGHAHYYLDNYLDALISYQQVIALDPANVEVWINKGSAHYKLKQYSAALQAYDMAIQQDEKNSYAYYGRGSSRAKSGDVRGSITDFDTAIRLGYRSDKVFFERGLSKAMLRQFQSARDDFVKSAELDPNDAAAFKKLGDCCYELKKFSEAIKAYDQSLKINPADKEVYSYRALCRASTNDLIGAIADYDMAIQLQPASAVDYYQRGMMKIKTGQKEQGCSDLQESGRLGFARATADLLRYCE